MTSQYPGGQPNQHTAKPKFDVDGNPVTLTEWGERRANGYVPPRDRPPEEQQRKKNLIKSEGGLEAIATRDLARQYAPAAMEQLALIAANGRNENARVAACNAILDRAWGKAAAAMEPRPQHQAQISVVFHDKPISPPILTSTPVIESDDTSDAPSFSE